MNVLLTGASGFVGQATLKQLIERGAKVHATSTTGRATGNFDRVEWRAWDASVNTRPPQDINYSKLDAIIHLASPRDRKLFPEKLFSTFRTNTVAAVELATVAAEHNIHFTYASTGDVFGAGPESVEETETNYSPTNFYACTKASAELLLRPFSNLTAIAILRIFHPYGPGGEEFLVNRIIQQVLVHETVKIEGNSGILLNPVWIDDLAEGICNAVEQRANGVFHLAGKENIRLGELVKLIAELAGIDANISSRNVAAPGGHAGQFDRAKAEFQYLPTTDLNTGLQCLINMGTD